jgi:hypothetical protein
VEGHACLLGIHGKGIYRLSNISWNLFTIVLEKDRVEVFRKQDWLWANYW